MDPFISLNMPEQFEVGVEMKVFISLAWFPLIFLSVKKRIKNYSWAVIIDSRCCHSGWYLLCFTVRHSNNSCFLDFFLREEEILSLNVFPHQII